MDRGKVTMLLRAHASGDARAMDELLPIVYGKLREMARRRMQRERSDHTLNATALVHEAYLKLVDLDRIDWQNRQHFLAIASRVMRNVLVDYAERRSAIKRGGGQVRVSMGDEALFGELNMTDVLAVSDALDRLAKLDERQVSVIECRFFGGLTIDETAAALDVSPATVSRDWTLARAWLNRELST